MKYPEQKFWTFKVGKRSANRASVFRVTSYSAVNEHFQCVLWPRRLRRCSSLLTDAYSLWWVSKDRHSFQALLSSSWLTSQCVPKFVPLLPWQQKQCQHSCANKDKGYFFLPYKRGGGKPGVKAAARTSQMVPTSSDSRQHKRKTVLIQSYKGYKTKNTTIIQHFTNYIQNVLSLLPTR